MVSLAADLGADLGGDPGGGVCSSLAAPFAFPLGCAAGFGVASCEQLTTRSFRLTYSAAPKRINRGAPDDALRRQNYVMAYALPLDVEPLVQWVAPDPDNGAAVIVFVDQPLPTVAQSACIVSNVESITGAPLGGPVACAFQAFGEVFRPLTVAEDNTASRDIANPQVPRDAGRNTLGVFVRGLDGDVATDAGRAQLRKRIYRRLAIIRGGFFHLPGYGLRQEPKRLITPSQLRRLQQDAQSQIRAERGVVAASVTARQPTSGVVVLTIRVRDAEGDFEMLDQLDFRGGDSA